MDSRKSLEDMLFSCFKECNSVISIPGTKEKLRSLIMENEPKEFQRLFFGAVRNILLLQNGSAKFTTMKTLMVKLFESDGLEETLISRLDSLHIALLKMLIGIRLFYQMCQKSYLL